MDRLPFRAIAVMVGRRVRGERVEAQVGELGSAGSEDVAEEERSDKVGSKLELEQVRRVL